MDTTKLTRKWLGEIAKKSGTNYLRLVKTIKMKREVIANVNTGLVAYRDGTSNV
jgi:hypothetical protein